MRLHITGGLVVDPVTGEESKRDVLAAAGRIVGLVPPGQLPDGFHADRTIDASNMWVMPGVVDLSARLREPGYEYMATLESEIDAALAGGVTSVICPPDTDPVLDEPGLVEMLKFKAQQLNLTKVYPLGALTSALQGEVITEMAELSEAGCVGFSQAEYPVFDTRVLQRAMQYAKSFNFKVFLRPMEPYLSKGGVAHAGAYASRMGLNGVPVIAETISLQRHFELVRATGVHLHVCRVSSSKGVEMIRQAKSEGLPVTCDVSVHHLHLTDMDIGFFDSNAHLIPPLREQRDRDALTSGVIDGTIDAICSDHTPVDDDDKLLPFAESAPGATGLELLLPLTMKWAQTNGVSRAAVMQAISTRPAQIVGLQQGTWREGTPADIVVYDPSDEWIVSAQELVSQGKHTPFLGFPIMGRASTTVVDGRLAYSRKAVV